MRLWTLHPRFLDSKGLVAAWREALLAQKVLAGDTQGYRHHPQLIRFQAQRDPLATIATFLMGLATEAQIRGYCFDSSKIYRGRVTGQILETRGQLLFEWGHLKAKLMVRAPQTGQQYQSIKMPEPHPLFRIISGGIRDWEKT